MFTVDAKQFTWNRAGRSGFFVGVTEASTLGIPVGAQISRIRVQGLREARVFLGDRIRSNGYVTVYEQLGGGGEIHISHT